MRVTVAGANGYQAKLVLAELSAQNLEVRLVGRNAERLQAAATEVGLTDTDRRVTTFDDHMGLVAALSDSDVVINCAGPFTRSGAAVVRAAIGAGVHYVDTSGEQLYLKTIFDTLAADAQHAGVTVVPSANDGCVPTDLLAHLLAQRTGPLAEMTISHIITGDAGSSRGTLLSALATLDAILGGGLTYDHGFWRTGVPARHSTITLPTGESMAMAKMPTCEVITIPRHIRVDYVQGLVEAALIDQLAGPVTAESIQSLPAGPTPDQRAGQRFTYVLDAVDHHGRPSRGLIHGKDTYGSTAAIAVEAARRLAAGNSPSGILTPAQAFDPTDFLAALSDHDLTWSIQGVSAT